MNDWEKVIKGLEIHLKPNSRCMGCPYPNNGLCGDQLYRDALALLKEQQPRVMTLEEAQHALHNDIVVWLEIKSEIFSGLFCGIRMDGTDYFTMQNGDVLSVTDLDGGNNAELYGKGIRAWTAKPDEKVRTETPWEKEVRYDE